MNEIRTEIDISASIVQVWSVLTSFDAYPSWNPFIVRAKGRPELGARLELAMRLMGSRAVTIRPEVVVARSPYEFAWKGKLLAGGLFDGVHRFELEERGAERTRLSHSERFSGLLIPFASGLIRKAEGAFIEMNLALKARSEAAVARAQTAVT
jgi:hypothetical protein